MTLINTNLINEKKLPARVKIATISTTCSLPCDINILDIWNHLPINDDIRTIKFNKEIISTDKKLLEKERKKREKKEKKQLQKKKTKSKSKRKSGENFYNCIIIVVNVTPEKIINIKLFKNGSIQMTGSKNLNQTNLALTIILKYLKMKYKAKINKRIVQIPLLVRKLSPEEKIELKKNFPEEGTDNWRKERYSIKYKMDYRKLKLSNFNINMINTSFALDYKIHLGGLNFELESLDDCIVTYEPSIHAGINIKINRLSDQEISAFFNQIKILEIDALQNKILILQKQDETITTKQLEIINKYFLKVLENNNIEHQNKNNTFNQIVNYMNCNFKQNFNNIMCIDDLKSSLKDVEKSIEKLKKEAEKKATILVFQSNDPKKMCNLIITGVTTETHIIKAYKYITELITNIKSKIIKINVEELLDAEMLRLSKEKTAINSSNIDTNSEDTLFIR
jgi:hypothetical protein